MDSKRKKIQKGAEMTQTAFLGISISVAAGFLIELFFQLIKYKDSANTNRPGVVLEYFNPTHYMSVSQVISSHNRRWVKYFTFRFLPPLLIFILLAAVLQEYVGIGGLVPFILLACIIALVPRDILRLFAKGVMISEKIIHIVNISVLTVLAVVVGMLASHVYIGFLAPSPEGVLDNLWAALFTAMLVAAYIRTSTLSEEDDNYAKSIELSNMILRSYNKISELYFHAIIHMCNTNSTSIPLFYAILIYEDMNRPAWIRKVENAIVKFTKKPLTVGIAQVKSSKPLTDIASMRKAAVILKNTQNLNLDFERGNYNSAQFQDVINGYNKGSQYQDSIVIILKDLQVYAGELFTGLEDIVAEDDYERIQK